MLCDNAVNSAWRRYGHSIKFLDQRSPACVSHDSIPLRRSPPPMNLPQNFSPTRTFSSSGENNGSRASPLSKKHTLLSRSLGTIRGPQPYSTSKCISALSHAHKYDENCCWPLMHSISEPLLQELANPGCVSSLSAVKATSLQVWLSQYPERRKAAHMVVDRGLLVCDSL